MDRPYIRKVEILNFRNFNKFSVTLEAAGVIVGENRSGKSNFLDALRLVLDPSLPDSQRTLRAEDFWDGLDKPFAGNIIEVKVYIRGFDHNKSAQSVLADSIIKEEPLTALLTYQFRPLASIEKKEDPKETDYEFVVFGGADEKNRVAAEVRKWLAMVVLPALRDAETDMQSWKKSPLRPLLDRARKLVDAGKLKEVRDILDDATKKLVEEPSIKGLSKGINERVRTMVGSVHSVETQFDFASGEPEQLLRSLRLFLKEKVSRPLSDASLGTANILFLSLLLQNLDAKIEAKELASTILAIEEPEAHLHPHLQRLLFRHFLRRDHPIIVTTHSPHLASVAPLRSLVLLRSALGETTGFTTRKLKLSTEEIDDLQRYLDATRAELLFAKGVVLVEGPAEQFILPAFAASRLRKAEVANSLDELGISVCSVHGTDFHPYTKLLSDSGLAIPHVVITDGDESDSHQVEKTSAGLLRGAKLVEDGDTRDKVQKLIDEAKYGNAKKALRAEGLFIGDTTLELDLLPILASEFKETYDELKGVGAASAKFSESVNKSLKGNTDASQDVLVRIERIGKGRFAQRLASKIDGQQPPPYIGEAIDLITRTVREDTA
jgi:putative ATP-dependent endonuclease of OLD family